MSENSAVPTKGMKARRRYGIARGKTPSAPRVGFSELMERIENDRPDLSELLVDQSSASAEIGEMVRSARIARGMSQKQLAEAAQLHASALSSLERGEGKDGPTYRKLRDIARALGMRFGFTEEALPSRRAKAALREGEAQFESLPQELLAQELLARAVRLDLGPEDGTMLVIGQHQTVTEAGNAHRRIQLLRGSGGFLIDDVFVTAVSIDLDPGQEVKIVNTGTSDLVVLRQLPETQSVLSSGIGKAVA